MGYSFPGGMFVSEEQLPGPNESFSAGESISFNLEYEQVGMETVEALSHALPVCMFHLPGLQSLCFLAAKGFLVKWGECICHSGVVYKHCGV